MSPTPAGPDRPRERELRGVERASAEELIHRGAALEHRREDDADDERTDHGDGAERHDERDAAAAGRAMRGAPRER